MARLRHPHIISLLGYCTKEEPCSVVMELMLYGDLKGFLLKRRHLQTLEAQNTQVENFVNTVVEAT